MKMKTRYTVNGNGTKNLWGKLHFLKYSVCECWEKLH